MFVAIRANFRTNRWYELHKLRTYLISPKLRSGIGFKSQIASVVRLSNSKLPGRILLYYWPSYSISYTQDSRSFR